jgi:SAM-dependent methyltransferase
VTADPLLEQTRQYYDASLRTHGPTPRGVDWNSAASQELRFDKLVGLLQDNADATVLDYGCGYGAMAAYLRTRGHRGAYQGFDLSGEMIAAARAFTAPLDGCAFSPDRAVLQPADVTLASGIFNVKGPAHETDWYAYMLRTLDDLRALSRFGFAFNALTVYSDPDKRRADLYYADPLALFEHCRRTFSRHIALLHDYPLYEFTISVRL